MKSLKKYKFVIPIISTLFVIFAIIIIFGLIHEKYGNEFSYSNWITLCINSAISILGALATICTVLIAIHSINNNNKNIKLKKRKLAIILQYELNTFLLSLFNVFYECMINWSVEKFDAYSSPNADFSNLNKLSERFKEKLYELIELDETESSLEIFEFYKAYELCIRKLNDETYIGLEALLDILNFCFKKEYVKYAELTGKRFNGNFTRSLPLSEEQQKELKEFYNLKESLYLNKDKENLLKNEQSRKIQGILNYLNKLINS